MHRTASAIAVLAAVFAVARSEAQVVRKLMSFPTERDYSVTIDDAGTAVYAVTSTNQFGTNPDYLSQIVRWDPATGIGTQITDYEEGVRTVSVSDDGTWLAFVSRADLLSTNHDESAELYVMHPDGTGVAQLTSESEGGLSEAVISGSGNRIAFVGTIDPLGTNPTHMTTLFVIDRDGTNLRQLKMDVALPPFNTYQQYFQGFDISDDGSKIVYINNGPSGREIAGINANGTGNHVFSSTANPADVAISGNGAKIVYGTGGISTIAMRARSFDGNPLTIAFLGNGERPSITDDATLVYHYRYASGPTVAGLYRIASTGSGGATLIAAGLQCDRVSGSGNRVVARDGSPTVFNSPSNLLALDDAGGNLQQLTTVTVVSHGIDDLSMSADGTMLRFSSYMDPLGTNPANEYEQFALALDTGQFTQLTGASLPLIPVPSFSDAGAIVFASVDDLTGQNPCGNGQIFRLDPGGAITQLTVCSASYDWNAYPEVRGDGQLVAFFSEDVGGFVQLFSINGDGTGRTQVTSDLGNALIEVGVGAEGPATWIAYSGLANGQLQIFRVRSDGTGLQQVTTGSEVGQASISGDGNRIAWYSRSNYVGQNPDSSQEVFLFDVPTGTIRQLTDDDVVDTQPRLTRDGEWVFLGARRFNVDSAVHEYASGYGYPDATGSRWTFFQGIWLMLADMNAVPAFVVGKAAPTVLSWDLSPTSIDYDVIRGSIVSLSIAGSTVDLGAVTCLEDDSPDAHTNGYGDPADPAPGEAFFFLYRGSVGIDAAGGSYGQGTGGKERVAGGGDCNP